MNTSIFQNYSNFFLQHLRENVFYRRQGSGKNSTIRFISVLLLVEDSYLGKHYNKLMAYETVRKEERNSKNFFSV